MRLSRKMERHLRVHIDLAVFRILSVIPQSRNSAVILLVPRNQNEDKYFNMKCCNESYWYCTIDQMLDDCIDRGFISRIHAALLKHSCEKFARRKKA